MQNIYRRLSIIILAGFFLCPIGARSVELQAESGNQKVETPNIEVSDFIPLLMFGENPGELNASYYRAVNQSITQPPSNQHKLVVLLHGCGQSGEVLSRQSGLLGLAKRHQFTLLIPQQVSTNNATTCFNWFSKLDQTAGNGETLSIMNMISTVEKIEKVDQVYIIGLSAGGAMASSLLSQYPERFVAGAVIAGIPFPCADNLVKAISCMKSGSDISVQQQAASIIDINKEVKAWPSLTVIAGSIDGIVNPKNAVNMAQQWSHLHNVSDQFEINKNKNRVTTYWGRTKSVELIELDNIGHGFPVDPNSEGGGSVAPFVVESDMSAAQYLIGKWIN